MKVHSFSWVLWLVANLVIISITRNPLYLVILNVLYLILLLQTNVSIQFHLRFSISMILLTTVLNAFMSHFGENVLFSIPGRIPLISGNITFEAVLYGLINGLVLVGIYSQFAVFNQVVSVRNLIRLIPQILQPIAVITTIALSFIPATRKQFETIREAQAVRGQQVRGLRDWLPLLLPLLIGGLERAMQLAEAMTARGFQAPVEKRSAITQKWLLIICISLFISGWFNHMIWHNTTISWGLIVAGLVIIMSLFLLQPKQIRKTHYRTEQWNIVSLILIFVMTLTILVFLLPFPGSSTLTYDPYPRVFTPPFALFPALLMLTNLIPLFIRQRTHAKDQ